MNLFTFTGRLTKDCQIRTTQSGTTICSFNVAVDYGFGENKGTNFIRCSVFGKRAEGKLPEYLTKAAQVAISGELKVAEYNDNEGNKRTSVDVNVHTLDLVGGKREASGQQGNNGQQGGNDNQGGGFPQNGGNQGGNGNQGGGFPQNGGNQGGNGNQGGGFPQNGGNQGGNGNQGGGFPQNGGNQGGNGNQGGGFPQNGGNRY